MSYTVEILRRAEKALRDLTDRKLYHRLRETIDVLASEPSTTWVHQAQWHQKPLPRPRR